MNDKFFKEYQDYETRGLRKAAGDAIRRFVDSFESDAEREAWTLQSLPSIRYSAFIRHELYAEVMFPVLRAAFERNAAWGLYGLAITAQNLYRARALHEQIQSVQHLELLKRCHAIEPNYPGLHAALLDAVVSRLGFALHEWPSGLLSGMDFATTERECLPHLELIALARVLDGAGQERERLDEYETSIRAFIARLRAGGDPWVPLANEPPRR